MVGAMVEDSPAGPFSGNGRSAPLMSLEAWKERQHNNAGEPLQDATKGYPDWTHIAYSASQNRLQRDNQLSAIST